MTLRSLIGLLRLVWPGVRDTIVRAVVPDHGAVDVTLSGTGIHDAGTVKMETMTPEPRAFRLCLRQPPSKLKMQRIGGETDTRRRLPLCRAIDAGGSRAAIPAGDAARFELAAGRNFVEAG